MLAQYNRKGWFWIALVASALLSLPAGTGQARALTRDYGAVAAVSPFASSMLAAHNEARMAIGVPAIKWNNALADQARHWAARLASDQVIAHSGSEVRQGENIWVGTAGAYDYNAMVRDWTDEAKYFRAGFFPDISTTGNWEDVGHYSQMIWRDIRQVGCGTATRNGWDFLVCRYDIQGNVAGKMPY